MKTLVSVLRLRLLVVGVARDVTEFRSWEEKRGPAEDLTNLGFPTGSPPAAPVVGSEQAGWRATWITWRAEDTLPMASCWPGAVTCEHVKLAESS